jgi:cell division protein FtsB
MEKIRRKLKTYSNYILMAIFCLMLISLTRNIFKIRTVRDRLTETEGRIEKLKSENEVLGEKLDTFKSDEYIEKQLRDKLGLAKEEEIIIVLPDEETIRKFAPKIEEEEGILPDPNWEKWLKLFF